MIKLVFCGEDYEQDIRPLIKAFFPKEDFFVEKIPLNNLKIDNSLGIEHKLSINNGLEIKDNLKIKDNSETKNSLKIKDSSEIKNNPESERKKELLLFLFKLDKTVFDIICIEKEKKLFEVREKKLFSKEEYSRRIYRNCLHRSLYKILSKITNITLPWGTLTGIRPTKQVLDRLNQNESKESIRQFMKEEYYCSEEKINLSIKVAEREKKILDELNYKKGYSIYIGIPFCPTTCSYCSFTSYPVSQFQNFVEPYLEALKKEILYAANCFPDKELQTIYFGGGTPTTLSAKQLNELLKFVQNTFNLENLKEITVEAGRPDSITKDKLEILKERAVNRISINPQSMNQKTLDLIGRKHTVEQIEEAFLMARQAGHTNINMDIILGLTAETPEDVANTLEKIKKLNPDSLTVHTLAIKRAARLNTQKELYSGQEATDVKKMLRLTQEFAEKERYFPYYLYRQKNMAENLENIGYARYKKEGIYNILIMEEKQTILALGAGGSSKFVFHQEDRIERVENVKSLKDYIERTDEMIQRKRTFLECYKSLL